MENNILKFPSNDRILSFFGRESGKPLGSKLDLGTVSPWRQMLCCPVNSVPQCCHPPVEPKCVQTVKMHSALLQYFFSIRKLKLMFFYRQRKTVALGC